MHGRLLDVVVCDDLTSSKFGPLLIAWVSEWMIVTSHMWGLLLHVWITTFKAPGAQRWGRISWPYSLPWQFTCCPCSRGTATTCSPQYCLDSPYQMISATHSRLHLDDCNILGGASQRSRAGTWPKQWLVQWGSGRRCHATKREYSSCRVAQEAEKKQSISRSSNIFFCFFILAYKIVIAMAPCCLEGTSLPVILRRNHPFCRKRRFSWWKGLSRLLGMSCHTRYSQVPLLGVPYPQSCLSFLLHQAAS